MTTEPVPPLIKAPSATQVPKGGVRRIPTPRINRPGTAKAREGIFRVVILFLLVVSIVLAWWSYAMVLTPRLEQSQRLTRDLNSLSSTVDSLVQDFEKKQEVTNKYAQVSSLLFRDEASLESWLAGLGRQAKPLNIDVRATFSPPTLQDTNYQRLAVIPTTVAIEVSPAPEGSLMPSRYNRLLQLVDNIAAAEKRIDLAELTVTGGTNSSDRAVMTLNLWAGEPDAK